MSVEVTCKKCGNRLRASDKYAGWRVQCPQCSAMNHFPAMGEPLPDTNDASPVSKAPAASGDIPIQAKPLPAPSPVSNGAQPAPAANQNPAPTGVRRCALCDRPISANDMAQDTDGNVYHRRCYDRERARRLAATVRQQGTPSRPAQAKPSTSGTPQRGTPQRGTPQRGTPQRGTPQRAPQAWVPPTIPSKPSSSASLPDAPSPLILHPNEVVADSSLLVPLPDPADSLVPADDLWSDPSLPSVAADAFGPAPIYEPPPMRLSQGMYTLIGIGAAMPVMAILAILVYWLTRTTSAPALPASSTAPSVERRVPDPMLNGSPALPSPGAAAAPASNLPVWQSDPAVVEQLGAYFDFDAYQIRLPKGYGPIQAPAVQAPGMSMYAWAGTQRPDGTQPTVLAMVAKAPSPQDAANMSVLQFHERMLTSLKQRRTDWQQTPVESGQVNGLPFARTAWRAVAPELSRKMAGVEYATKDGATFIQLRSQDVDAYHEQALKLGTASILTFRKK